jgi:hypothetical protein
VVTNKVFQEMIGLNDVTALGGILSALTMLVVCKIATDLMVSDPDSFEEGVAIILVGSLLSAVLLFTKF